MVSVDMINSDTVSIINSATKMCVYVDGYSLLTTRPSRSSLLLDIPRIFVSISVYA